jgi:recombinational DNA repair protein RecR
MVLKYDDIDKYLTKTQLEQLTDIISSINNGRLSEKKRINKYIICNMDEPYSAAVLNIIKRWRKQDHVCQNCFCAKEDHNKERICSNPQSDEFHNYVDGKFYCDFWVEE